ncbi:unnamed protein product, partial [Medioppia subpectinata]
MFSFLDKRINDNNYNNVNNNDENVIKNIKLFHVFDDHKGYNVLFVTHEDLVYGLGSNYLGALGLGHNRAVKSAQIIPQLCYKTIRQFVNGYDFVLCITGDHCVYGWGCNGWAQLAREVGVAKGYAKPDIIAALSRKNIREISCGFSHSLALTGDGCVYGWGYNRFGQVGSDQPISAVPVPTKLRFANHHVRPKPYTIKNIYAWVYSSFAITTEGQVFSWGRDECYNLGHNWGHSIAKPRLIVSIAGIQTVCAGGGKSCFLSNDGFVYFCGQYVASDGPPGAVERSVRLLDCDKKCQELHKMSSSIRNAYLLCAVIDGKVWTINRDHVFRETTCDNVFDFYLNEFRMTYKTVALTDHLSHGYGSSDLFQERCLQFLTDITWRRTLSYWQRRNISGPRPVPFYGNTYSIALKPGPVVELEWYKKYGKLFGVYNMSKPALTVAEPSLVKQVLVKEFHRFRNRSEAGGGHPVIEKNLFNARDEHWKRIRAIASPVFTSGKLKRMLKLINGCARDMTSSLDGQLGADGRCELDIKQMMGAFTMDVIATTAFATKINTYGDPNNRFTACARNIFNTSALSSLVLATLPKWPLVVRVRRWLGFGNAADANFIIDFSRQLIAKRKRLAEKHDDFVQLLIDV